jgi:hypothetical protein
LELLVQQTSFAEAALLEEADGGDIGERLTNLDLGRGQGRAFDAKMSTAPMTWLRSRIGRAWTVVKPSRPARRRHRSAPRARKWRITPDR